MNLFSLPTGNTYVGAIPTGTSTSAVRTTGLNTTSGGLLGGAGRTTTVVGGNTGISGATTHLQNLGYTTGTTTVGRTTTGLGGSNVRFGYSNAPVTGGYTTTTTNYGNTGAAVSSIPVSTGVVIPTGTSAVTYSGGSTNIQNLEYTTGARQGGYTTTSSYSAGVVPGGVDYTTGAPVTYTTQ